MVMRVGRCAPFLQNERGAVAPRFCATERGGLPLHRLSDDFTPAQNMNAYIVLWFDDVQGPEPYEFILLRRRHISHALVSRRLRSAGGAWIKYQMPCREEEVSQGGGGVLTALGNSTRLQLDRSRRAPARRTGAQGDSSATCKTNGPRPENFREPLVVQAPHMFFPEASPATSPPTPQA